MWWGSSLFQFVLPLFSEETQDRETRVVRSAGSAAILLMHNSGDKSGSGKIKKKEKKME